MRTQRTTGEREPGTSAGGRRTREPRRADRPRDGAQSIDHAGPARSVLRQQQVHGNQAVQRLVRDGGLQGRTGDRRRAAEGRETDSPADAGDALARADGSTPLRGGAAPGDRDRLDFRDAASGAAGASDAERLPLDFEGGEPEEELIVDADGGGSPDAGVPMPGGGPPDAGVPLPGGVPAAPGPAAPGPAAPGPAAPASAGLSVGVPTHVRAPSTPSGMPDRIPPRVDTAVAVTISGWRIPMNAVTFSIQGTGGGNGSVTVDGAATSDRTSSGTVNLRGVNQTAPGSAGNLRLVAEQGGATLARSSGFSVAAIPQNFSIAFDSLVTGARRGIRVENHWESDSGNVADLDQVERSEQVQYGPGSGVFAGVTGHNSGYLPANNSPTIDTHSMSVAAITGAGTLAAEQVFIFKDDRTGVTDIPVRNSGFRVTRIAIAIPLVPDIVFTTSKAGTATTANGFSSAAGSGSVTRPQLV